MAAKELTPREQTFTAIAFQCMPEKPHIDWAKFATMAGLKNAKSARDSFAPTMKKLLTASAGGDEADNAADDDPVTPKPVKKGGRKRKADTTDNGEATPKPKKPATKSRKAKAKEEDDEDEDTKVKKEEEDMNSTPGGHADDADAAVFD